MVWYSYYTIYLVKTEEVFFPVQPKSIMYSDPYCHRVEWKYHFWSITTTVIPLGSRQRPVVRVIVMTYPPSKSQPKRKWTIRHPSTTTPPSFPRFDAFYFFPSLLPPLVYSITHCSFITEKRFDFSLTNSKKISKLCAN